MPSPSEIVHPLKSPRLLYEACPLINNYAANVKIFRDVSKGFTVNNRKAIFNFAEKKYSLISNKLELENILGCFAGRGFGC